MIKAVGSGSTLRVRGEGNDVYVYLGVNPQVYDDGFSTFVPISGSYGVITRFSARGLTGSGVTVIGDGGSEARHVIYLSDQDDFGIGGQGADRIFGYGGSDSLFGRAGNDYMRGGNGDDILSGSDGKDRLYGDDGNDEVYGGSGADKLYGGAGNDLLSGGGDNDRLYGEAGRDLIDGGAGIDVAYYSGNADDYRISIVDGNYRIVDLRDGSPDGTDYLGNVERLNFADRNMGLDPLASELEAIIDGNTLIISGQAAYDDPDHYVTVYPFGPCQSKCTFAGMASALTA